MKKTNAALKKIQLLLILCLIGTLISMGTTFFVYLNSKHVAQAVGKDTVPSIVAAQSIKATLANANSNAMNAMATKEKLGGKFWTLYRKDLNSLHSQLVEASKSITYGDEEQRPIEVIASNLSAYEYTVGGAVANGAEISVDQFMEANRLMQQKILPASTALNNVNISQLDETYNGYDSNIENKMNTMILIGFVFIGILAVSQVYLFRRTRRIFNVGLLTAGILFTIYLIYSAGSLYSVRHNLQIAKQDAFTSINALWNTKAVAYNAKSMESLYLLHHQTGIVQTADTINFNLSASLIYSEPKAAATEGKSEGYLNDVIRNTTFKDAREPADTTLQHWQKYVDLDKKVRNLEYDSKHDEAIALSVGDDAGQANNEFTKFDTALEDTIKIHQVKFDDSINSVFKTLNFFPYVSAIFLIAIIAACIFGLKARIDEFKV